jgi:hypothetical protein
MEWVVIGLVVAVLVITLITSWWRRSPGGDLGSVSHQWISEHRLGSGEESRR